MGPVLEHPDFLYGRSLAIKAWQVLARTAVEPPAGFMDQLAVAISNHAQAARDLGTATPGGPPTDDYGKWRVSPCSRAARPAASSV